MYICICRGVTDTQIREAVQNGANSLKDVRRLTGASSQCGKCSPAACELIKQELVELELSLSTELLHKAS